MGEEEKTRHRARMDLIEEGAGNIDYEDKYRDEDRDRKVLAGVVAGEVYSRTSAPDSRTYIRNPTYWGGRSWYWGDSFHIRLPVLQALPAWSWLALFWSTAFFVSFVVVMILLSAP